MTTVKALDDLTPAELWREVPLEQEFWQVARERQRYALKLLLESALEEEMVALVAAGRYRRTEVRRGYRNGYYERDLATQIGVIKGVRVPRACPGGHERGVFHRYQRRQAYVDAFIRDIFLAGVSTRRVGAVLERLLGEPVSAQTVSRVARSLDQEVARFHQAPLLDDLWYLFLDGVSMRVRGAAEVKRRVVLCAYGITCRGERRLVDFRLAKAESAAAWEAFVSNLRERGLWGQHLKLVVTDGCPGLHAALETVYPYVPRQRCWAHKLRNVANLLKRSQQAECLKGARAIYEAATRRAAVRAYWEWARRWRGEAPKAVACLERDLDELLHVIDCPEAHRKKVRTTNVIERAFREVRRRTRPMSCFTNDASCERIIYAVLSYLNRSWEGRLLPEFPQK
jgi:putative transposase